MSHESQLRPTTATGPVELIVPGDPVPWARAGSTGKRRFTPPRQAAHVETIRRAWLVAGRPDFGGEPVSLSVEFHVAGGRVADIDNYLKLVLDALSGCMYDDDRQVVCLSGVHIRRVESNPRTVVTAWRAQRFAA